jgi:hypothetical protein
MSSTEDNVKAILTSMNIDFEQQKEMPLKEWPWKTSRSRHAPKCDFYVKTTNLYVEVKGFMTVEQILKIKWLAQQGFNYYLLQMTEGKDWPSDVDQQIREICDKNLNHNKVTLDRLSKYIKRKEIKFNEKLR